MTHQSVTLIDIPTEELKVLRSLEHKIPHTIPAPTRKHIDKATNIIYTHMNRHTDNEISGKEYRNQGTRLSSHNVYTRALMKFNSQLNTSEREPTTCDTPVSHSIDIPTEELKVLRSLEHKIPHTIPAPTRKHIDKATNIIYTHMNRHTDNEISEKE